jgi:hypothetical protein
MSCLFGGGFLLETKGLKIAHYCGHDWIHFSSSLEFFEPEGGLNGSHVCFILHNPKLLDIKMGIYGNAKYCFFKMKH